MIDELSTPDFDWPLSNSVYYTSILASSGEHQDNEKTGVLSGNFFCCDGEGVDDSLGANQYFTAMRLD